MNEWIIELAKRAAIRGYSAATIADAARIGAEIAKEEIAAATTSAEVCLTVADLSHASAIVVPCCRIHDVISVAETLSVSTAEVG